MGARDLAAFGTGAAIGAAVILGLWAANRPPADPHLTSVVTTTTRPTWVSPLEARIGPSVVFPTALEAAAGELLVAYEVHDVLSVADRSGAPVGRRGPGAGAAPARWTLIGPDFEAVEDVVSPSSRGVRFTVPPGFVPGPTTRLRLDAYWLAAGIEFPFDVDRSSAAWYPIGPGLRARLVEVIEQADNAIVIVEVDGPQALTEHMTIDGAGREWVSSSRSMLGSHRWTLDYRGDELPNPLPLVVRGVQWLEVPAAIELELEPILP